MRLVTYDQLMIDTIVRKRTGEIRLGEMAKTLPWNKNDDTAEALEQSGCRYVLLGLPEDIGVRANGGRGGSYSAWQPVLNTLLNSQSNEYLRGDELLVLGHIDFSSEMESVKLFDFHKADDLAKARTIVSLIDDYVTPVIEMIINSGKEAIVIGGGHNNAYPCIKGTVNALKKSGRLQSKGIHVLNCDAHSDFRPMEGRHSGNPFSYAFNEGLMTRYSVTGLHESYNSSSVFEQLKKHKEIQFATFEDIYIREEITFSEAVSRAIQFTGNHYAGLEIDMDAIQNIPSSAKTSSGISTIEARKYVYQAALKCNISYFHIAEAAPVLSHIKTDLKTGKLVSYLVTDYIKARNRYHSK
jgi:formiminoglutamase